MEDIDSTEGQGTIWTLQEFSKGPTGHPWFALQRQNDQGIQWGTTGTRHELAAICSSHGITPQKLERITEDEYYRRMAGEMPGKPAASIPTPGRFIWDQNSCRL
jgi:hypothetical protein